MYALPTSRRYAYLPRSISEGSVKASLQLSVGRSHISILALSHATASLLLLNGSQVKSITLHPF